MACPDLEYNISQVLLYIEVGRRHHILTPELKLREVYPIARSPKLHVPFISISYKFLAENEVVGCDWSTASFTLPRLHCSIMVVNQKNAPLFVAEMLEPKPRIEI